MTAEMRNPRSDDQSSEVAPAEDFRLRSAVVKDSARNGVREYGRCEARGCDRFKDRPGADERPEQTSLHD
jgi:hypothetical protein